MGNEMTDEMPEVDPAESNPSVATQFKFGNTAWRARSSHGRNPKFSDPDQLMSACEEYFAWVEENPIMAMELCKFQGSAGKTEFPKVRAMTQNGLCNFLDIHHSTWIEYRQKPDFSEVCQRVDSIIYQQKFEFAAADMLNANIIARDLGLADKKDVVVSGALSTTTREMTLEEASQIYEDNLKSTRD